MGNTESHSGDTGSHKGNTESQMGHGGNNISSTGNPNNLQDTSGGTATSEIQNSQPATVSNESSDPPQVNQPPSTELPEFACPICLGTTFRRDQVKRLRCSHVFHQACIDMWLHSNRSCPLCRTPYRRLRRHRHRRRGLRRALANRRLR